MQNVQGGVEHLPLVSDFTSCPCSQFQQQLMVCYTLLSQAFATRFLSSLLTDVQLLFASCQRTINLRCHKV